MTRVVGVRREDVNRVVLGSASPGRLGVLRQAGVDPLIVVSGVDEDAAIASLGPDASPGEVVCALAVAKADDVVTRLPTEVASDCVVIGCDSMLYFDGRVYGKPADAEAARRQWESMAGRAGMLYTGHAVIRLQDRVVVHREVESATTTVHFGRPSAVDLDAYIDSGEPLKVAGGFTLDGLGGWFVDRIEGDPSNVIGISLPLMRNLLARAGVTVAQLWSR
jgi:septum formation protein